MVCKTWERERESEGEVSIGRHMCGRDMESSVKALKLGLQDDKINSGKNGTDTYLWSV